MNGLQLTQLMQILGVTCKQVADACGYDNIYRIVKARGLGTAEIPIFIESSLARLIGKDRYTAAIDRLVEVSEGEIRSAKRLIVCSRDIELTPTQLRWLQTIAAQYSSKRRGGDGKEIRIQLELIDADQPTDAKADAHRAAPRQRGTPRSRSLDDDTEQSAQGGNSPWQARPLTIEELENIGDPENDIAREDLDDDDDVAERELTDDDAATGTAMQHM